MCENIVEQVVPTRFSAKIVKLRCGSTSIYGTVLQCPDCVQRRPDLRQAWQFEDSGDDDRDPNWRFEPVED